MPDVVVTGSSGFVGRQVVAALAATDARVAALSRRRPHEMPQGVTFLACDLLEPGAAAEAMRTLKPTHLVHAAWDVTPGQFWGSRKNLDWAAASLALYREFAAAGGRRAVFLGTCAEYDWHSSTLAERSTPTVPITVYGAAKHGVHTILEAVARQHGGSLAWGRLFLLYGPHEAAGRLVSDLTKNLLEGRRVAVTEGVQLRDFMHVADAGAALARLLRSDVTGPVNIATGRTVPVRTVCQSIAALTGRPDLLDLGARPTPAGEPPCLAADVTRLRQEVGFSPRFDLESGLADTVAWWRSQLGRTTLRA
jgi:nucleoside-diphosphate-sugar epimerase